MYYNHPLQLNDKIMLNKCLTTHSIVVNSGITINNYKFDYI